MKPNAATWDRVLRALTGLAMLAAAFLTPFSLIIRALVLGGGGAYLMGSALVGSCLGYRMMGISTCPATKTGRTA